MVCRFNKKAVSLSQEKRKAHFTEQRITTKYIALWLKLQNN